MSWDHTYAVTVDPGGGDEIDQDEALEMKEQSDILPVLGQSDMVLDPFNSMIKQFDMVVQSDIEMDHSDVITDPPGKGIDKSDKGIDKSDKGIDKSDKGIDQSYKGIDQSYKGIDQSDMGIAQSDMGIVQSDNMIVLSDKMTVYTNNVIDDTGMEEVMKSDIVTEQLEEWMQSGVPMEQLHEVQTHYYEGQKQEDMNKDKNSYYAVKEESDVKEEADEKTKEWDGKSVKLEIGLTFQARSEARKFVKMYGDSVFCKMSAKDGGDSGSCKSRKIMWTCTYGYEKPSVATKGRRPHHHSKKKQM